jgi:hypothetical protein
MTDRRSVADAHHDLEAAEARLAEATEARNQARAQLDAALAATGWHRLVGVFSSDVSLYESKLYPSATLSLGDVLEHLAAQREAAR